MQKQIKQSMPLLLSDGTLAAKGYATSMTITYNRQHAKGFPLKLKEWNFYQIQKDHWCLQLTLGHVSYMCSVAATLMDVNTGKKWSIGTMKPLYVPKLDRDPEGDSLNIFESRDLQLSFRVTQRQRLLEVRGTSSEFGQVDISIALDNDRQNEKMVIATPFEDPKQFYLNYKENYYTGTGHVRFGDLTVDFDGCTGLVDWGRGIWPYRHEWFWGSLSTHLDGVPFGFNIGWGFGDLRHATENMVFYNKKAYKLGTLRVQREEDNYLAPWTLTDEETGFVLHFAPIWDNYTENKFYVVDTHCNQIFGYFSGSFPTEAGEHRFENALGFIEHAVNRW